MRKQIKFALLNLALSIAGLASPELARAQYVGTVSLQTVQQTLANTVTCTGAPQIFVTVNLGQSQHLLTATSNAVSFSMEIDGIDKLANVFRISNPMITVTSSSYLIQGSGYLPIIEASVTCTAGGTFSLSYSGTFTASNIVNVGAVGTTGGSSTGGNVQGVVGNGINGLAVLPIVNGGLEPATNAGFNTVGLDTFGIGSSGVVANGVNGTFPIGTPPSPTKPSETGLLFYGPVGAVSGTGLQAPWSCLPTQTCGVSSSNQPLGAFLNNVTTANTAFTNVVNNGGPNNTGSIFILLNNQPTIRQSQVSNTANPSFVSNTLAGSTLLIAYYCNQVVQCVISSVADTQGNTWRQVAVQFTGGPGGAGSGGTLQVWMSQTTSTAAADTITATVSVGSINGSNLLELTSLTAANLNQPNIALQTDSLGSLLVRTDAQQPNLFTCSVTLSSNTTTQCQPAPANQTNSAGASIPLRLYVTDFQINTTAAGTATTIQLKDGIGTNCGTATANLSAIAYPNTTTGITSILGDRTPLFAPLSSAVCVTQAGTTPGTSVVEIRGFIAP